MPTLADADLTLELPKHESKQRLSALRKRFEASAGAEPVYVDGPYGSPSGHIFESRHAVPVTSIVPRPLS